MNFTGIIIGIGTFLIIGFMHPVVIKTEYYFSKKAWPFFLVIGLVCIGLSILIKHIIPASLFSVLGFSFLWGINELIEQEERVRKGWFPENPKRKDNS